jgi:predicted phosphate transport protein (TIGR00153 family)
LLVTELQRLGQFDALATCRSNALTGLVLDDVALSDFPFGIIGLLPSLACLCYRRDASHDSLGESPTMPGLLQRFLPPEEGFFDLFAKQAANIHMGADTLLKMLSHYTGVPEQVQIVKAIEHEGDEITHTLFTKLNQTFITPFDREDIYELCSRLDDVIDLIDAASSRFVLYRVDTVRTGTVDLVKVLVSATAEVEAAVRALETPQQALKHCIEINRYENESDRLCRTLIAQIFDEERDPVQIIKWKEIFEVIETAVDKCEDVANVIEGVILKTA